MFVGGRLTTHRLGSNTVDLGAQHLTCQGNIIFHLMINMRDRGLS